MPPSFGVHIGPQDMTMDQMRALWRSVDQAGLDWVSIWDHFYEAPPRDGMGHHFETLTTLAALAADTDHVRVGCLVFCAAYRNPGVLAKALATLDHLSGGRMEAGFGAGWHEPEYLAYGYDFPPIGQRMNVLEETVQIVRSMLRQDHTTFEGRHYSVYNATCQPPPVQSPLPIWVGGEGEKRTLRIAARFADAWNVPYIAPERFRHLCGVLDDWCRTEGRDPATIKRTVNLRFNLTIDPARVSAIRQQLRADWGDGAEDGSLVGTPDQIADRVAQYIDAGAQGVNVALRAPWDEAALDVYMSELVPVMRRRFAEVEGG